MLSSRQQKKKQSQKFSICAAWKTRNLLKNAVDAGLYTKEFYKVLTEDLYQYYVPYTEDTENAKISTNENPITRSAIKRAAGGAKQNKVI